jgi:type III pantothenate kinase
VGRSTVEAIQSGLIYGYAGLVDGLVTRVLDELGSPCPVVATGGLAEVLREHIVTITHLELDLTLVGLAAVYGRNQPERAGTGS